MAIDRDRPPRVNVANNRHRSLRIDTVSRRDRTAVYPGTRVKHIIRIMRITHLCTTVGPINDPTNDNAVRTNRI